ncbi:MAG: caspase family protein [Hyphomonadaceae bacterium]
MAGLLAFSAAAPSSRAQSQAFMYEAGGTERVLYQSRHALLIGASDYRTDWTDLPRVPNELSRLQRELEGQGFQVERVDNPTGETLRERIQSFIGGFGEPETALLIVFSGHGWTEQEERGRYTHGYIVPIDAPSAVTTPRGFHSRAMSMQQIRALADDSHARHTLFVFDSCFSGSIFNTRGDAPTPARAPHDMQSFERLRSRNVQFLTAGDEQQRVPSESKFMDAFILALRGAGDMDGDGYITASELAYHLIYRVDLPSQSPQFNPLNPSDTGDFVFKVREDADIEPVPFQERIVAALSPDTSTDRSSRENSSPNWPMWVAFVVLSLAGVATAWRLRRRRPPLPAIPRHAPENVTQFFRALRAPKSLKSMLAAEAREGDGLFRALIVFAEKGVGELKQMQAHLPPGIDQDDLRAVADAFSAGLLWLIGVSVCRNHPSTTRELTDLVKSTIAQGSDDVGSDLRPVLRWFRSNARAPERVATFDAIGKELSL